jgi:hypothetical protein
VASSKRKVTKSKGKASNNGARGSRSIKKKRSGTTRQTKKTNRRRPVAAAKTQDRPNEAPRIKDSSAVKKARSSVEAIVEDAQKTVEETIEPSSRD